MGCSVNLVERMMGNMNWKYTGLLLLSWILTSACSMTNIKVLDQSAFQKSDVQNDTMEEERNQVNYLNIQKPEGAYSTEIMLKNGLKYRGENIVAYPDSLKWTLVNSQKDTTLVADSLLCIKYQSRIEGALTGIVNSFALGAALGAAISLTEDESAIKLIEPHQVAIIYGGLMSPFGLIFGTLKGKTEYVTYESQNIRKNITTQ